MIASVSLSPYLRWHDVIAIHATGTAYTIAMQYWECRSQRYYAGQDCGTSRFPVRSRGTRCLAAASA
jgi:hypothetical protein